MAKIGVTAVRMVLVEVLAGYSGSQDDVLCRPEERLLKTDLHKDYGLDASDFAKMLISLNNLYNIEVDENVLQKSTFFREPTVENFIRMVNDYGL